MDGSAGRAALAAWVENLRQRGYAGVRDAYFGPVFQEWYEHEGRTYELTTEALWDGEPNGNMRVLIELSDSLDQAPRLILEDSLIVAPDGSFAGE